MLRTLKVLKKVKKVSQLKEKHLSLKKKRMMNK